MCRKKGRGIIACRAFTIQKQSPPQSSDCKKTQFHLPLECTNVVGFDLGMVWQENKHHYLTRENELVASFAKRIKSCNDKSLSADLYLHHRTKPNAEQTTCNRFQARLQRHSRA